MTGLAADRIVISITDRGFGGAEWSTIIATLIAALVAVAGYTLTRAWTRRERRAKEFADALAAVEEYLEAPYRVRRRQGSTPEVRAALAAALSDLQARIALHRAWLQVEAPAVGLAYDGFISAARGEAGTQMADAWNATALTTDAEMNLKVAYPHPRADVERAKVAVAMRRHLRVWRGRKDSQCSPTQPQQYEADQVLEDQQPYLGCLDSWDAWQQWRDAVVDRYEEQGDQCPLGSLFLHLGRSTPGARAIVIELMRDRAAPGLLHRDRPGLPDR